MSKVCDLDQLKQYFIGTPFEGLPVLAVPTRNAAAQAFAVPVNAVEAKHMWQVARRLTEQTQRYPVLLQAELTHSDLDFRFSDYGFDTECLNNQQDISVQAILSTAQKLNIDDELKCHQAHHYADTNQKDVLDMVDSYHADLTDQVGTSPTIDQMKAQIIQQNMQSWLELELWLTDWLYQQKLTLPASRSGKNVLFSHTGDESFVLVFLSTPHAYEMPAYLHFFGALSSPFLVALFKRWHDDCAAEIFGHYGTIMTFLSPANLSFERAKQVALEQHLIAPYDFFAGGDTIYSRTFDLMRGEDWFIHERP